MQTAGIITEYNPLHMGHVHLMKETRRLLGPECAVVCIMSGQYVQRGDFALVGKYARAEAAVRSGADLVLELPLPWAVSSAERFARGGVQHLLATGLLTHLAFGSECGDAAPLQHLASVLLGEEFPARLKKELAAGVSFAAARQRAMGKLVSREEAALLESPNNILGVEYCKELLLAGGAVQPLTVKRVGAPHDGEAEAGEIPSATAIRERLRAGRKTQALEAMAPAMAEAYLKEEAAGRAPVYRETCERAILARLRSMSEAEFAALDEGREGLYRRVYRAVHSASGVDEILERAKTKRYAYARLRRMLLWAYLGLTPGDCPEKPLYLRPLAANEVGRALLGKMRKTAEVPVLTKPAAIRRLEEPAQALFALEARAADLYTLAYPDFRAAAPDGAWKESPILL